MASQSHDHFPSTHRTWIADHLTVICEEPHSPAADVAHRTLSAYIMNRYNEPLRAYVSAAALRDLGEPQELVASFFARSFDNSILLQRWISSGIALRRWLMNAISLHCRGLRRDLRRNQSRVRTESELGATGSIDAISSQASHSAERAFDRAWALASPMKRTRSRVWHALNANAPAITKHFDCILSMEQSTWTLRSVSISRAHNPSTPCAVLHR